MKRTALLRHLRRHGCYLKREGRSHSLWCNPATGAVEAVPRHTEIAKKVSLLFSKGGIRQATAYRFARSERFVAATSDPASHEGYLATKKRFVAGTNDPASHEVYLATETGEIYIAELSLVRPKPKRLDLAGEAINLGPRGRIRLDAERRRLFVLDNESEGGRLYLVDLAMDDPPVARLVAQQLGDPRDIGVDPKTGEVYIADAKDRKIWRLTCDSNQCDREVFAQSDKFKKPSLLAIGPDGIVWVADIAAQSIFGIGPDGNVRYTISEPTE